MLSWEFPPLIKGGLGRVVKALATELAGQGHDVHVVTEDDVNSAEHSVIDGVHVHRVKN